MPTGRQARRIKILFPEPCLPAGREAEFDSEKSKGYHNAMNELESAAILLLGIGMLFAFLMY